MVSCIIRIITTGTLLSATGATVGAPVGAIIGAPTVSSLMLPLISLTASDLGIHYNRKKLIKIINLLVIYQKDKGNKMKIRENLISAGINLFKSFEIKFKQATFHSNHELALLKLAHDAVDRIFNFFNENSSVLEAEDFLTVSNITKAVILGRSKRHRNIFSIPNRHLGYSLDNGLTSKRIYQETPVLKIISADESYCYKKNNARDIADFRLIFAWEEEGEELIKWGLDEEIVLSGNRLYQKITSTPETSLDNLTLIHLSQEALEEKKQKIFFDLSSQYQDMLGDAFKQEFEAITGYMRNGFKEEANKFKQNISDLNTIIITTMESLTKLKEGQEDIKKQVKYLQERKFTPEEEGGKEEIISISINSILNRLKEYLATIVAAHDQGFYTPLNAYYDLTTSNTRDRFSLLDKIISFIKNPQQKNILILGEAGSGKTSFLVHLSQFLLKNPFFSTKNQHVLPFYIRLARIKTKQLKMTTIERLLQDYYHFNSEEVEFLFKNQQQVFCFILDDMDELDQALNRILIEDIYNKFPASHCIFTAHPDSVKPAQITTELFTSLSREEIVIINLAPFNEPAKKDYINKFKGKNLPFELAGEDDETIYRRIKAIPSLDNIIDKPIFLRMAMEVLVPLEKIYQHEEIMPEPECIRKDLFHLYTHSLYTQMAEKFKTSKGITHIAQLSIYDCILTYSINLAKLMQETNILEIDASLLNENFLLAASSSAMDQSNLTLTHDQFNHYKKCFTTKYNPQVFKDNNDYKQHKYGYKGCLFVHTYGTADNISYAFSHKEFLNYFCSFDPIRRKKIKAFIDPPAQGKNPMLWSRQSSVKERASVRSHRSFDEDYCSFSRHASEQEEDYLRLRHASDQEGLYLESRRSSASSVKEEGATARSRHTSDQTHQTGFFTNSGGRGRVSYLSHVAGHDTSAAEHTIDSVTDSVLNII